MTKRCRCEENQYIHDMLYKDSSEMIKDKETKEKVIKHYKMCQNIRKFFYYIN